MAQKDIVDKMLANTTGEFDLELKINASLTLTGKVLFSSLAPSGSWGDKISVSFNFVGNGAPAKKEATP